MVGVRNSVDHMHMSILVAAELPQHSVEQQRRPGHPVVLVSEAQRREPLYSEYGVHLTSVSVRASNCPTKSLYTLFV
jgi:hypothetical protein